MKKLKQYIDKYNQPNTVAVISLYPKKGEVYSSGVSGVASYTKNVIKKLNRPSIVIADGKSNKFYEEGNSLVIRSWKPNTQFMWIDILSTLKQLTKVESLLIHFDFSMYGGIITSGLVLPFLAITRLMGFKSVIVTHHVIQDVSKLSGQVGITKNLLGSLKTFVYNFVFKSFYWLLGKVSEKIVLLEKPLKKRLTNIVSKEKIEIIPHAVDKNVSKQIKNKAKKKLGYKEDETLIMFFGYVNWFKGADFFANAVKDIKELNGKKVKFVMAGGKSPTMKDKQFYKEFFSKIKKIIRKSDNLELTGYVPQDKIKTYFAASDLVVFPYREFMCASGVMSLVFSYGKPFIISNHLRPMLQAPDFAKAMKNIGLRSMDMTFLMNKQSLTEVMERVLENGLKAKMRKLATVIRDERSFSSTSKLYEKALKLDINNNKKTSNNIDIKDLVNLWNQKIKSLGYYS